jgi:ribosome-associated toxin RatA of RatAB toxin-antitoxin module
MRNVRRSALVPFKAHAMYALVNDVASYPRFLPWCRSATVHVETESLMEASLELVKGNMAKVFTTRNRLSPGQRIEIGLLDGPFRHLDGIWRFEAIDADSSEVALEMSFEFDSLVGGLLFGPMFEDIATSLVGVFSQRAHDVYGRR